MEKAKIGCDIPCNMIGEYNLGSNTQSTHIPGVEKEKSNLNDLKQNQPKINMDVTGVLGAYE